ncbi:hypothetical protein L1049_000050 [Liquidambar formosana]|uniref:FBD domain-containing protein n=1 Tax=Liquidambar formosana TaxID=63359 RepID=A0AAP0R535_LIQFO
MENRALQQALYRYPLDEATTVAIFSVKEFSNDLKEGISHWVEDEFVQEMLPQCFQSSLKVVEFQKFYGKEHEYDLLKFLLENAMVLEEMVLVASKRGWDPKIDMEQVKKQLLTFPKGSNCATIVFSISCS